MTEVKGLLSQKLKRGLVALSVVQAILHGEQQDTDRIRLMSATITAHLPEQLLNQADRLVQTDWASDLDAILTDALRRYLDSHSEALTESFIREDIEWGLHGHD